MPSTLDYILQGKLMAVSVNIKKPCKCNMCSQWHDGTTFALVPATKKALEVLFKA